MEVEGQMVFRSTSPLLVNDGKPAELRECPVGFVARECPQAYDAILAHTYSDNGCINPLEMAPWGQEMIRIVGSERARHREAERAGNIARNDAAIGAKVLGNG